MIYKAKPIPELTEEQLEQFWSKVKKTKSCWNFESLTNQGYGQIMFNRKNRRAHVVSYELLVGKVPDGLVLDHTCRNRACVNPKHLEPVTNKENILRGEGITAKNKIKTHCRNGHEYNERTMYLWKGHRQCRTCKTQWEMNKRSKS